MNVHSMKQALGTKVIDIASAEVVGKVKEFVVDRSGTDIVRLQIAGRKKRAQFVDWSQVSSFGADAVMVTVATTDDPASGDPVSSTGADDGRAGLLGARILDTGGFEHGAVDDAMIDGDSGTVVEIRGGGEGFNGSAVRGFGSFAVVVDAMEQ
jgi:uncharacterized protein YrrD